MLAQRTEVYDDLLRALQVMSIVNERTPVPNVFYAMWLLENRQLSLSANINVSEMIERDELILSEENSIQWNIHFQSRCNFVRIAEVLQQTFENKVDLYWITKGFYKCAQEILHDSVQLKDLTFKLLEKEHPSLYRYISFVITHLATRMCTQFSAFYAQTFGTAQSLGGATFGTLVWHMLFRHHIEIVADPHLG